MFTYNIYTIQSLCLKDRICIWVSMIHSEIFKFSIFCFFSRENEEREWDNSLSLLRVLGCPWRTSVISLFTQHHFGHNPDYNAKTLDMIEKTWFTFWLCHLSVVWLGARWPFLEPHSSQGLTWLAHFLAHLYPSSVFTAFQPRWLLSERPVCCAKTVPASWNLLFSLPGTLLPSGTNATFFKRLAR